MEEIKKVINRLKETTKLCMSRDDIACLKCEYQGRCTSDKNADILRVMKWAEKKLESTDDVEKDEVGKHQSVGGIKGERDKALLNLYKHYNRMTALEDIDYTTLESMHILIDSIEKLEHARHMEASDEIAKTSFEKLEKFARPMPVTNMSLKEYEEFRAALDKYEKKEGAGK